MTYDITVIGAGIVGCSIAYRLSKYNARVLVLDKENDIANEVTMANSAIVHAGDDPEDGTLKAKLNLRGAELYTELLEKLHVRYRQTGAYTVMTSPEQEDTFNALVKRTSIRHIPYEILDGDTARKNEPNLSDKVIKALSIPSTRVIIPWEFAEAEMEVALRNGVELKLNTEVKGIRKDEEDDGYVLTTNHEEIRTRYIVNAAGLFSDEIAAMIGTEVPKILPRKGEYFVLSHNARDYVSHIIYPMPTAKGKGVLAVPTVDGNVLLGPDSEYTDTKEENNNTTAGLGIVRAQLTEILKNIPYPEVIRIFAGLRPSTAYKDFYIEKDPFHAGIVHLAGIDSPGVASAPGIAEYVENLLNLPYEIDETRDMTREKPFDFSALSIEEKNEYIHAHPEYGHIVCRCEQISEGEIVEAIHRPVGAKTVKGVKKRVRPGMGKCQGGFCEPLVVDILARELNIPKEEVLYDSLSSHILTKREER
ncbi:MAG: NAD(P)/FAD-dependent oxidoreductase [Erysipelotrichales bacterium]|nr:NAD(P)/FAD-dependent oxidoreductase [Erysipelotrichales bacterium]